MTDQHIGSAGNRGSPQSLIMNESQPLGKTFVTHDTQRMLEQRFEGPRRRAPENRHTDDRQLDGP